MTVRSPHAWLADQDEVGRQSAGRDRLRVPAALLDALCLSALLWLTVLTVLR